MLDPRRLRTDLEGMKAALARRGGEVDELDRAAALDARQRDLVTRAQELRTAVKALSAEVGRARKAGDETTAELKAAESRALGEEEKALAAEADVVGEELRAILLQIPNAPAEDCPDGTSAEDNVVVRHEGWDPDAYADHQRVPHWEIGASLGILDLERGYNI